MNAIIQKDEHGELYTVVKRKHYKPNRLFKDCREGFACSVGLMKDETFYGHMFYVREDDLKVDVIPKSYGVIGNTNKTQRRVYTGNYGGLNWCYIGYGDCAELYVCGYLFDVYSEDKGVPEALMQSVVKDTAEVIHAIEYLLNKTETSSVLDDMCQFIYPIMCMGADITIGNPEDVVVKQYKKCCLIKHAGKSVLRFIGDPHIYQFPLVDIEDMLEYAGESIIRTYTREDMVETFKVNNIRCNADGDSVEYIKWFHVFDENVYLKFSIPRNEGISLQLYKYISEPINFRNEVLSVLRRRGIPTYNREFLNIRANIEYFIGVDLF